MGENTVMLAKRIKLICVYNYDFMRNTEKTKGDKKEKSSRPEMALARAQSDAHRLQIYQHAQCWGSKNHG